MTDLDDALEVKIKYWIKDLQLLESDQKILSEGSELNDRLILAGQSLLSKQFPHINGLQDTMLSNGLRFLPVDQDGVQILHTGMIQDLGQFIRARGLGYDTALINIVTVYS